MVAICSERRKQPQLPVPEDRSVQWSCADSRYVTRSSTGSAAPKLPF